VIEWLPRASAAVASAAVPAESGALPSDVAPSKNWTEPPGLPAPGGTAVTVAVSVTLCANADGFGALVNDVVVLAGSTVCACAADVPPVKFGSPAYTAVSECPPTASDDVLIAAEPPETVVVPSDVAPSKNSIEPPGLPAPGAFTDTLAVTVTLCPTTDGFGELVTAVLVLAWFTVCACTGDVLVENERSPL
jgi:hypothetical protein